MPLDITRKIRCNIHGSINLSALEDKIIAHPYVQRLRRISQTAFLSYVFPGASHSRFEHSLGAMHLAERAWQKLGENQRQLEQNCARIPSFTAHAGTQALSASFGLKIFNNDYIRQCLRIAALLHDVGHPPMSHSGEKFLPSWEEISKIPNKPDYLDLLSTKNIRHEVMSTLMVEKILTEVYSHYSGQKINPRDVVTLINPEIFPELDSPIRHCISLCRSLISGEIDVDRMDYLRRDSREAGVHYGIFDQDRIMDSLLVYSEEDTLHLGLKFSGLAAYEDYLRARQSMFLQLYFHKTAVACEAMLKALQNELEHWRLPADLDAYAEIDDFQLPALLRQAAAGRQSASELVEQLFVKRKLWKRIYENIHRIPGRSRDLETAENHLRKAGFKFQSLSNRNELSNSRYRKSLRLIKQDAKQIPKVIAIDDYLDTGRSRTILERIYVPADQAEAANKCLQDVFALV